MTHKIIDTNSSFALIIKTLLSFTNKYHKRIEIPSSFDSLLNEITLKSKHQLNDGTNEQSVMDNELGFYDIYPILKKKFYQIEKKNMYTFWPKIVGGIRCETREEEYELADLIKNFDEFLCQKKIVSPYFTYFVGRKK